MHPSWWSLLVTSIVVAGIVTLSGCVEQPAPVPTKVSQSGQSPATAAAETSAVPATFVLATGTVYYSGDPQRGHKPDGTFRRGTKVSLLHRAGNYSMVRSEDGIEAYVATHTLEPLAMQ